MDREQFDTLEELLDSPLFIEWVRAEKHSHFWNTWRQENPDKEELLAEAKKCLEELSFVDAETSSQEVEEVLGQVWEKIDDKPANKPIPLWKRYSRPLRIAAAVLLLLTASWTVWQLTNAPFQVYKTAFGETQTIELPDGSTVILQANSQLKVAKDWTTAAVRLTQLDGEAYFSVEKGKGTFPVKFVVETEDFQVEVLGTQFNVLDREEAQRVVLVEGKVQLVKDDEDRILMAPNEMVTFSTDKGKYEKTQVQSDQHTAWAKGQLLLNNTPLLEMARMLRDNYGFEVRFAEEVDQTQKRTSLGLIPIRTPNELMEYIAAIYEVQLEKEGQVIYCKKMN